MERLTRRTPAGVGILKECDTCRRPGCPGVCVPQDKANSILAKYEDTRYSPEDFDKLCREMSDLRTALGLDTYDDLRKIIQADRLLVLPCAIGAPVYVHEALCDVGGHATFMGCKYSQDCRRDRFIKCPLRVVKRAFTLNMRRQLGRSFWLTEKEAEDAIPADRRL